MTFWNVGDEETTDPKFCAAGPDGFGLYHMAGSWCMSEYRGQKRELPAEWFIPKWWTASHPNGTRTAKKLVRVGLWKELEGGYGFAWIRDGNTPAAVGKLRKAERDKKARQRGGDQP